MPIDRYYIDAPLNVGERITLEEDEAHHLLTVTRTRLGEIVEVVNGRNVLAKGALTHAGKGRAEILIQENITGQSPSHEIILVQAMPRPNRLELVLEKGCELGMTKILLFPGERGEKRELNAHQLQRMTKILIGAMKQCGRLDLPQILFMPKLVDWKEVPKNGYFGSTQEAPVFSKVWKNEKSVTFFVGPEGGFSEEEIAFLEGRGVLGVSLHPNTLRTETASLAALTLITHWLS